MKRESRKVVRAMKQDTLKVSGTIDKRSYLSISRYMLSLRFKILFITAVVLLDLALIAMTVALKDVVWLLLPLMLSIGAVTFYRWNLKNVVNRVIASIPGIRDGKGFDLDITLDDDALRVHNRATGLDTALAYEVFASYAQTDEVLALFVKTGTYLLIPTATLEASRKDEVLQGVRERCGGLRERRV